MEEVLDILVNILCPTPESYSACTSFLSSHAGEGVLVQLIYFFFFPTVFIILFIYILSSSVLSGGLGTRASGLRLLIGVGVYIYIIINGWYAMALPLAEFWFIIIIIIFGIWYFIRGHFSGSVSAGRFPAINPVRSVKRYKEVKNEINSAQAFLQTAKKLAENIKSGKSERPADDVAQIKDICNGVGDVIRKYEMTPEGLMYQKELKKLKNEAEKLLEFLEKISG